MSETLRTALAGGAVAISLIALAKDEVRRPRLTLAHQDLDSSLRGNPDRDLHDTVDLGSECFVRLRVRNAKLVHSAEDTEVLVVNFQPEQGDLGLDVRPLIWTSFSAKKEEPVTTVSIPPGVTRHVDLIRVVSDGDRIRGDLLVHPQPISSLHRLEERVSVGITLAVAARDTSARFYTGRIDFDPQGGPGLADCVRLRNLSRSTSPQDALRNV